MPQCLRYESPTVPIDLPSALVDAVESLFDVTGGGWEEIFDDDEWAALKAVVEAPNHATNARTVSDARNVFDSWTLNSECDNYRPDEPIGERCEFCVWCQALIIRDWLDKVLDDAGLTERHGLAMWIEVTPEGYDPGAEYERIWAAVNSPSEVAALPSDQVT